MTTMKSVDLVYMFDCFSVDCLKLYMYCIQDKNNNKSITACRKLCMLHHSCFIEQPAYTTQPRRCRKR